ncbi:MAG: type IV secretion system DNA-binding domain-containing protein [Candidatus Omnitrophota bacterium]
MSLKNMLKPENEKITIFAETNFRNEKKKFGIKRKDRRYHMYVVGKTGVGKSTLISNMVASDLKNNEGLALLDPHGDLIKKVLQNLPKSRLKDLIYFNPMDSEETLTFNPLEVNNPYESHLVVSFLISAFKKIWNDSWGPRMEYILRNALLTLVEFPNSTLLHLQRLLSEKEFRKVVVEKLEDNLLKNFWLNEFEKYSSHFRQEAISPIQNKIGQFLSNPVLRRVVSQPKSGFDVRKIMDEGKILLVNLAKGMIGEDSASLLGAMLIAKIGLTALSRQNVDEEERKDFYLYVDEFQSFATSSFTDILSEARKYRLNLILANQYLTQIDEKIRGAILGNVGTLVSFKVGAEDAKYLTQEFFPVFDQEDLVNLPCYSIYLKLMVDGKTSTPFSADTLPPSKNQ